MSKVIVQCAYCGNDIERAQWRLKAVRNSFCGHDCHNKFRQRRVVVPCSNCGGNVERRKSRLKLFDNFFCSDDCLHEFRSNQYRNRVEVPCTNCGDILERTPSRLELNTNQFCDASCKGEWMSNNLVGEDHPTYRRVKKPCDFCGKEIEKHAHHIEKFEHHFCNRKCAGKFFAPLRTGDNNPLWKEGDRPSYYGPNWHPQRRKARKRDGYKCQGCGVPEKRLERELHVHHIIPFREFGYIRGENDNYKQANKLTNLISLCTSCHTSAEHGSIPVQPNLL